MIDALGVRDTMEASDDRFDARELPEAGGAVGPLPDGTLIEVRPTVSWGGAPIGMVRWLREQQGWSIPAGMDEDAAIAAYNEEQENPG